MQVRNGRTGEIIEVPDGTPDDDIHAQFSGAQQQNVTPLAQSFAGGAQQAVPQLAQQLIQGPEQSTLPNIGGGAMVGLTPQQAQFTLQSAQQSNVDSMANKLQQQQMVQQSLEAEKDRSQVLKLRQQDLKNRIAETKMLTEQAKFEAQMKVKEKELEEAGVTQRKLAEINGPYTLNEGAERRQGSELLAENQKTFAPDQPSGADWEPFDIYDQATGTTNQYLINKITKERSFVGPVAPVIKKGGEEAKGRYRHPTISDSLKIKEAVDQEFLTAKAAAENAARAKAVAAGGDENDPVQIDENAIREEVSRKVRRELNISAFPNPDSAKQFMDMQAEQFYNNAVATLPPGALTPETARMLQERATNLAQVERWKADGYVAYIGEDGEAVVETDDGKEPGT